MSRWSRKKSNTEYAELEGHCSYAMVYRPDEFRGKEFWKINFYPKDDSVWAQINRLGIQAKVKNDTGEFSGVSGKYITVRRDVEREFPSGLVEFTPPEIQDIDGNPLVSYKDDERVGDPILIGNGSLIGLGVEIYPAGSYGKGCRMKYVRLIDLIEYTPPEDENPEEEEEEEKPVKRPAGKSTPSNTERKKPKW